jgi:UDP-N-acetylglucosamine diphosphorylase/glucosamine-1-phosphate N-acetyltransferase
MEQEIAQGCAAVILAAGLGKRMKSEKAKVLHELRGRPMVVYVAETAERVVGTDIIVVVGHQAARVRRTLSGVAGIRFALQEEQLGTGHAVACALPRIPESAREVIILYGDVPLLRPETIHLLILEHRAARRDLSVLAVKLEDPKGYGRVLLSDGGDFVGIVEEADASADEKRIDIINTGIYCVNRQFLSDALPRLRNDNAQGEYYLTDIVGIGHRKGRRLGVVIAENSDEVVGINSLEELSRAETILAGGELPRAGKIS